MVSQLRNLPELADLQGHWQLARVIVQADGARARFNGNATFTPQGAGLAYEEIGTLILPGGQGVTATRRYQWQKGPEVRFDDGRAFHVVPGPGRRATHLCPPDNYEVRYDFSAFPVWRTLWRVTGPRKDYRMLSRYAPAP